MSQVLGKARRPNSNTPVFPLADSYLRAYIPSQQRRFGFHPRRSTGNFYGPRARFFVPEGKLNDYV
jgi:hypothetical protein